MANEAKIVISAQDKTREAIATAKANLAGMQQAALSANLALASLGVGVSVAGIASMSKALLDGIDALNDWKDTTSSSIENLSALEDVGLRTGTSMDTIGSALVKFNKVLADADPDSNMAQALKRIGLNAEDLRKLDPAEALRVTAVALQGYAEDGDRARLVQELFGKSVREVAPFLKDLSEQQKLQAKVTTQQAEEAEKLNKQIFSMQANFTEMGRAAVNDAIPAVTEFLDRLRGVETVSQEFEGLGKAILVPLEAITVLSANVKYVLEQTGNEIGGLVAQLAALARLDFKGFSAIGDAMKADAAKARAEIDKLEERLMGLKKSTTAASTAGLDAWDRITAQRGAVKPSVGKIPDKPDKPTTPRASREEADQYALLIQRIREKTKAEEVEAALGRELTQAERERLTLLGSLEGITQKDTQGRREQIRASIEKLFIDQKANDERKEAVRVAQDFLKQRDAEVQAAHEAIAQREQETQSLRDQLEEYGLLAAEVDDLRLARLSNALAREEERLADLRAMGTEGEALELQRERVDQLREQLGLQRALATARNTINTDGIKGAKDALDEYLTHVKAVGDRTKEAVGASVQGLEDVLTDFFATGKADWKAYANEVIRQIMRILVVQPLVGSLAGSVSGALGGGGGSTGAGSFSGNGTQTLGTSLSGLGLGAAEQRTKSLADSAVPAQYSASGGPAFVIEKQENHFGANVSKAEVLAMQRQANAELEAKIIRSRKTGGAL